MLLRVAQIIILMRAGLGLDLTGLKKIGRPAIFMCFIVLLVEIFSAYYVKAG